ncbi:MAG: hypothetical protein K0U66_08910 [Gammaproteobacteria bacterium]|nr:hypothetical protein [Gammaproteobacteria bacterium]
MFCQAATDVGPEDMYSAAPEGSGHPSAPEVMDFAAPEGMIHPAASEDMGIVTTDHHDSDHDHDAPEDMDAAVDALMANPPNVVDADKAMAATVIDDASQFAATLRDAPATLDATVISAHATPPEPTGRGRTARARQATRTPRTPKVKAPAASKVSTASKAPKVPKVPKVSKAPKAPGVSTRRTASIVADCPTVPRRTDAEMVRPSRAPPYLDVYPIVEPVPEPTSKPLCDAELSCHATYLTTLVDHMIDRLSDADYHKLDVFLGVADPFDFVSVCAGLPVSNHTPANTSYCWHTVLRYCFRIVCFRTPPPLPTTPGQSSIRGKLQFNPQSHGPRSS